MAKSKPQYWLMKSEPDVFSFSDLKRNKSTWWDGVRNYMARNYMTQNIRVGDVVLFYHSNAKPPGVAGIAKVTAPARPDVSAMDSRSPYYDPKATHDHPRWYCVEVSYQQDLPQFVSLDEIKKEASLKNMVLLRNSRLSVQPVKESEFKKIISMAGAKN